ncbi:DUF1453 domain-containing protein [Streptomyces sp. NPDC007983]|uniref:DUF1453 domain-containing protein n=1 Tax=Streptomyces sp. NPDC007983 TaxID=3364800 RepID=UPI0036E323E3
MSGPAQAVLIAAVVVIVLVRQFRPQRVTEDARRWWVVPVVLGALALREPGLIDHDHRVAAAALLVVEVLVGVATGVGWGWTSRVWTDASGAVWAQGAKTTAMVWAGAMVCRLVLAGVGALAGVPQGSGPLMLSLAASLLLRGAVVMMRARGQEGAGQEPVPGRAGAQGTLGR